MANDRDCENCVHKVNGACTVWDCKFEPKRGMTREEAKELLLNISAYDIDTQRGMKKQETIEMAIKALEQEPCDKCVYSTSEGCQYDDITETIPPCGDVISRQATIKYLCTNMNWHDEDGEIADDEEKLNAITDLVNGVPPVTPQQKIGHWIGDGNYICSCCKRDPLDFLEPCGLDGGSYMDTPMKYCPHCGAKMVEPIETS